MKKNLRLLVLALAMIINAAACIVYSTGYRLGLTQVTLYAGSIAVSFVTFVHWMFCYTYLKLTIEVKYMFDRRIFTNDHEIIEEINRYNFYLNFAHTINIAICVVLLIVPIATISKKSYFIANSIGTSF